MQQQKHNSCPCYTTNDNYEACMGVDGRLATVGLLRAGSRPARHRQWIGGVARRFPIHVQASINADSAYRPTVGPRPVRTCWVGHNATGRSSRHSAAQRRLETSDRPNNAARREPHAQSIIALYTKLHAECDLQSTIGVDCRPHLPCTSAAIPWPPGAVNTRPSAVVVYIALADGRCAAAKCLSPEFVTKLQRKVPLFLEIPQGCQVRANIPA